MLLQIENRDSGFRIKTSLEEQTFLLGAYSYASENTLLTEIFQNTFPSVEYIDEGDWEYRIELEEDKHLNSNDSISNRRFNSDILKGFKDDVERFENALRSKNTFRYHQKTALEEFKLPNPLNKPELYRLCKTGKQSLHLQILWNLASDDASDMISPSQALSILEQLHAQKQKSRKLKRGLLFTGFIGIITLSYFSWGFIQSIGNEPLIDLVKPIFEDSVSRLELVIPPNTNYYLGNTFLIQNESASHKKALLLFTKPGRYLITKKANDGTLLEQINWISYGIDDHPYKYPFVHFIQDPDFLDFKHSYFNDPSGANNRVYLLNPTIQVYQEIDHKIPWTIQYIPSKILAVDGNQNWQEIDFDLENRYRPHAVARLGELEKLETEYLVSVSDLGSKDPNGYIARTVVDWGDSNVSEFSGLPAEPIYHKYTQSAESRYIQYSVFDDEGNASQSPYLLQFDPNDIDTYEASNLQEVEDEQVQLFRYFPMLNTEGNNMAYLQTYYHEASKELSLTFNPRILDDYTLIENLEIKITNPQTDEQVTLNNVISFKITINAKVELSIQYNQNGNPITLNPFVVSNDIIKSLQ